MNDNNRRKDRSKFTQMLDQNSPFDSINFGIDTKYFDASVGYDRDRGTSLTATLDLNMVGKSDEQALIAAKVEYERERMKLALERQRLENQRYSFVNSGGTVIRDVVPNETDVRPIVKEKPKTEEVYNPKISEVKEDNYGRGIVAPNILMSAKAFLDDDEEY